MKLVACETVAAIVHHLRVDDGDYKPSGGLRCSELMLCKPREGTMGWDLPKCPIPESPDAAERRNMTLPSGQRWCQGCIRAWREALTKETS